MTKTALIIATDGTEDIELIVTSDVLRRGGIDVTIAGLADKETIELARQAVLRTDKPLSDVKNGTFDAVILPGGPGYKKVGEDKQVGEILSVQESAGRIVAAICAAPAALKAHNIGKGATVTAYPSVREELEGYYTFTDREDVVVWKNIVTSRGPGTAFAFALKLVELLAGADEAKTVREALLL